MTKKQLRLAKQDEDDMPEIDLKTCKIIRRGPAPGERRRLNLAGLRGSLDITQAEIAKRAGISQSEVSRAELRDDCLVSTLRRYAKALGGELELIVKIKDHEYPVTLT
jgi:DNA-binding XRE family transcriptional regulator